MVKISTVLEPMIHKTPTHTRFILKNNLWSSKKKIDACFHPFKHLITLSSKILLNGCFFISNTFCFLKNIEWQFKSDKDKGNKIFFFFLLVIFQCLFIFLYAFLAAGLYSVIRGRFCQWIIGKWGSTLQVSSAKNTGSIRQWAVFCYFLLLINISFSSFLFF